MDPTQFLDSLQDGVKERFRSSEQVLSFDEFLQRFAAEPYRFLRSAPQYLAEMFDHFGTIDTSRVGQDAKRHRLFDLDADVATIGLVGQERTQGEIYQYLQSFARRGKADKMLLLHGPNGSGKTTIIENIIRGLEAFSRTSDGVLMTFSWVFTDKEGKLERIGFETGGEGPQSVDDVDSFSQLGVNDLSARFGCELHDSPLFLIPAEDRLAFVEGVTENVSEPDGSALNYRRFLEGDLCQKCRRIYDTLLVSYDGDWRKVIRHVRVERFVISKRYRTGAVSIEPQGNVDSGTHAITSEHSWHIPMELRNVTLYQPVGDIVDANRGVLEYSDFLKRSLEVNKYLLTTCERGTASLQNCMAYLDLVIFATANEKQLSLFKRSPDFSSFKGRMELIAVPYLLRHSTEVELYRRQVRSFSRERHVTPHASGVAALWAVLTRLRKPMKEHYHEPLASAVARLTPLEKAQLYDSGEPPEHFSEEEKKALRTGVLMVRAEFEEHEAEFEGMFGAEYEGRRGVSPREMLTLLSRAAQAKTFDCLTPMAVLDAIEELIRDVSLHDFLRLPAEDGYNDVHGLLQDVRREYLRWVLDEVYDSIGLIDESEHDRVFLEYFRHVKAFDSKEKVYNVSTNSYEDPNDALLDSIEKLAEISESKSEWRSNIMTKIAAWSLDHRNEKIDYHGLFPGIYRAMRDSYNQDRNRILTLIERDILKYGTDEFDLLTGAEQKQVRDALGTMKAKYRYCENCARDVIAYVLRFVTDLDER